MQLTGMGQRETTGYRGKLLVISQAPSVIIIEKTYLLAIKCCLGIIFCGTFQTQLLGMFLALTGYRLNGADVYHAGLATHYVGYLGYLTFCYNNLKGSTKTHTRYLIT